MDEDPWYDLLDEEVHPPSSSFEKSDKGRKPCLVHGELEGCKGHEVNAEEYWYGMNGMIDESLEQVVTKLQDMHELLVCVAKEVQNIGAHVKDPNIAAATPTSTSKVMEKKERRHVPKKKNHTTYCYYEILDLDATVLICLTMMLCLGLITLFIAHLIL